MAEMAAETAEETSIPDEEEPKAESRLLILIPEVLILVVDPFPYPPSSRETGLAGPQEAPPILL
jgi:hypothetical protein